MARFRYQAFISYSHADHRWGEWLHRALETFRLPRGLPENIKQHFEEHNRRCYRDEAEEGAASDLGQRIELALQSSATQIVIASPRSATSKWVNQEILRFKSLGREDRIFVLIVDGQPHADDPAQECFAEALKWKLGDGDELSNQPADPLAVDVRKFGRYDAVLRIMSGLLGIQYDDLKQRDLIRQRKQRRRARLLFAAGLSLTIVAIIGLWLSFVQAEDVATRSSLLFAQKASDLSDEHQPDRALMWAVGGLPHPTQLVKGRYDHARAQFVRAFQRSVSFGHPGYGTWSGSLSNDGSLFVTNATAAKSRDLARIDVWNNATGELLQSLKLPGQASASARFGSNPELVLVKQGKQVLAWNRSENSVRKIFDLSDGYLSWAIMAPGDSHALVSDTNGDTHLVSIATGESRLLATGSRSREEGTLFSEDGSTLVLNRDAGRIRLDLASGQTIPPDTTRGSSDDGLRQYNVSANREGVATVTDPADEVFRQPLEQNGRLYRSPEMTPDSRQVLAFSSDGEAFLHDAATGALIRPLGELVPWPTVRFSADGNTIIGHDRDDEAVIIDLTTGQRLAELDHDDRPYVYGFDQSGDEVLTRSRDTLTRWDVATGEALESLHIRGETLDVHQAQNGAIEVLTRLEPQNDEFILERVDSKTGRLLRVLRGHTGSLLDISANARGGWLVTLAEDRNARIWNVETRAAIATLETDLDVPGFLDFWIPSANPSPDGRRLLTWPTNSGSALLWDTDSWNLVAELPNSEPQVVVAMFSPDSRLIATSTEGGEVRIWSADDGALKYEATDEDDPFWAAAFSPSGDSVLLISDNYEVKRLAIEPAGPQAAQWQNAGMSFLPRFAPNGAYFAEASNSLLQLHESSSGKVFATLDSTTIDPLSLRFTPDGSILLGAEKNGRVRTWSVPDGYPLLSFQADTDDLTSLDISLDGTRILTASKSNVALWDFVTGAFLRSYGTGRAQEFTKAVFSPDGTRIYAGTAKGLVLEYDALSESVTWSLEELFQEGCGAMALNKVNRFQVISPILEGRAPDGGNMTDPCDRAGVLSPTWWKVRYQILTRSAGGT